MNFQPVIMALIVFQLSGHTSATAHLGNLAQVRIHKEPGFRVVPVEVAKVAWFFCKHKHGLHSKYFVAFSAGSEISILK